MAAIFVILTYKKLYYDFKTMKIAIEGCCHGELDTIYAALRGQCIELLLICGDFQAIRNSSDLDTISTPTKYKQMGSFYKF